LQREYQAVQQIWTPIQEAQHKEAARLDALQIDVDQTLTAPTMPLSSSAWSNEQQSHNAAQQPLDGAGGVHQSL
jgi:hypothetical protein